MKIEPIFLFDIGGEVMAALTAMILIFMCLFRNDRRGEKRIIGLLVVDEVYVLAYLISNIADGRSAWRWIYMAMNVLTYSLGPVMLFSLFWYLVDYLNIKEERGIKATFFGLLAVTISGIVMSLISLPTGLLFSVDAGGNMVYGEWENLISIPVYVNVIMFVIVLINYRKRIKGFKMVIMMGYVLAPFLVGELYYVCPTLELTGPMMTILLLMMYCVFNVDSRVRDAGIKNELAAANRIQTSLLPQMGPGKDGEGRYGVFARMTPAREVGGDFYDYFAVGEDKAAIVIGDVSGKGISAALFMTVARTLIKNHTQYADTDSPARILEEVQRQLDEGNELSLFVTVWLGIIDLVTGRLSYCSAGHDYPALSREGAPFEFMKEKNSPALALFPWIPLTENHITLQEGDRIFLYTDGLPEAVNEEDEQFGMERTLAALNSRRKESDEGLIMGVDADVRSFIGRKPQFDDLTMLSFTFKQKCE